MLYSLQVCPIKVQLQTFLHKLISRNLGFDSIQLISQGTNHTPQNLIF